MVDNLRQRALLEENYYDAKRQLMRQKEAINEKENDFRRARFGLMEKVYSIIPSKTQDLSRLDSNLQHLNNEFIGEMNRVQSRLEDEERALTVKFNSALDNLI